mgnify:CR=1 FL=1
MNWQEIVKYSPQKYDSNGNRNKLQFVGESAVVGRALTKTFIHNPLMLFEPSAIPLCPIWSYENKFSRPYMP